MSEQPPAPPSAPAPPALPTAAAPLPSRLLELDWLRLPAVVTALGVGLLSAAVVLASAHSREGGDLDGSNVTMGVLATLGLVGIAVAGRLLVPGAEKRAALVSWPGAAGALGAGLMLAVLIDDGDWSPYAGSLVVVALSVGGYLLTRAAPFVLSTIAGLAVLYVKVFDDVVDLGGHGDNTFLTLGAGVFVFVLAVTVAGWLLPGTRVLSAAAVGFAGLAAMAILLVAVAAFRLVGSFFDSFSADETSLGGPLTRVTRDDPFRDDVWVILVFCAALAAVWAIGALATGHVVFRLLLVTDAVAIVPLVTLALLSAHPTWWEVVCAGVGGLLLLAAGALLRGPTSPGAGPVAPAP